MINMSTKEKELVSRVVGSYSDSDSDTKAFFLWAVSKYRGVNKDKYQVITKSIVKEIKLYSTQEYVIKHFRGVLSKATKYKEQKVISKLSHMSYDSVSKLVMLFSWLEKNKPEALEETREYIKGLYEDSMSHHRYDNTVQKAITHIKSKYQLKETEGEYKFSPIYDMVANNISKMSQDDKDKLLALLQA